MTILYVPPRRSTGQVAAATRRSIFFQLRRVSSKQLRHKKPALVSPSASFCSIDDTDSDDDDNDNDSLMSTTTPCSSLPRPILKRASPASRTLAGTKKQVHWSEEDCAYYHQRHLQNRRDPKNSSYWSETTDSATAGDDSRTSTAEKATNTWYTRKEIADFRRTERLLFQNVPAVVTYLVECRQVFHQMDDCGWDCDQPQSSATTSFASDCSCDNNNNNEKSPEQSFETHSNNILLRNGRSHYKGMERARVPWRVNRTRSIVKSVVQMARVGSSTTVAALATRLTATDQQWARFVAYLDEQELSSSITI